MIPANRERCPNCGYHTLEEHKNCIISIWYFECKKCGYHESSISHEARIDPDKAEVFKAMRRTLT